MTAGRIAAAILSALLAGACGSATPPPGSGTPPVASQVAISTAAPSPSARPGATDAAATIAPTAPGAAATGASGSGACTMPPGAAAPVPDPTLLDLLPSSVGGAAVAQEPDSFAQAVADPCFAANVDRAAFPIVVSGSDLSSGVLAHVRPGVYSDAFFGDWRATYDIGACGQAGGVVAHAEETVAGRTTYVTDCGGGVRVYHTYLAGDGVIVSLVSIGPADLGGQVMAQIRG